MLRPNHHPQAKKAVVFAADEDDGTRKEESQRAEGITRKSLKEEAKNAQAVQRALKKDSVASQPNDEEGGAEQPEEGGPPAEPQPEGAADAALQAQLPNRSSDVAAAQELEPSPLGRTAEEEAGPAGHTKQEAAPAEEPSGPGPELGTLRSSAELPGARGPEEGQEGPLARFVGPGEAQEKPVLGSSFSWRAIPASPAGEAHQAASVVGSVRLLEQLAAPPQADVQNPCWNWRLRCQAAVLSGASLADSLGPQPSTTGLEGQVLQASGPSAGRQAGVQPTTPVLQSIVQMSPDGEPYAELQRRLPYLWADLQVRCGVHGQLVS